MSEHTPTPWTVNEVRTQSGRAFKIGADEMIAAKGGKGACIIYDDHPGNPDNERAANAAFIVRACNAHDELVAALERAQEELRLIRMKDCGAVYDTMIRTEINIVLAKAHGE